MTAKEWILEELVRYPASELGRTRAKRDLKVSEFLPTLPLIS